MIGKLVFYLLVGCLLEGAIKEPWEDHSILTICLWPVVLVLFGYTMILNFSFWLSDQIVTRMGNLLKKKKRGGCSK